MNDFVDSMMAAREKGQMTDEDILHNTQNLVLGGFETTATSLSTITYLLATHKDVLTKLENEVRTGFNSEEEITRLSVHKSDYMFAIIEEFLRVSPAVPPAIPRITPAEGATIRGEYIPPKTMLSIWQWSMGHSPEHFKDPESFIPERWLGDPRFASDRKQAMQAFSWGPRNCIGRTKVDVLIDKFRPGVLEKLDLCPEGLLKQNPRLIVVRLTGFRCDGKYKNLAGHDINYLAVSGLLSMLGARGAPPAPPANILGDYAGGGLVAFAGVLLAILHRGVSGYGQVVEASMIDGAGYLGMIPRLRTKESIWNGEKGSNLLDGGYPYYRCYECKDAGKYMSVGALEPRFFANLLRGLELNPMDFGPGKQGREDSNACVAPVLESRELEEGGDE
ncbi:putative CoA-transferase family III domain-containing protein [Seiridium unicorne]|uniref:CoA-transferase family III domain-containing protein n=1 Tax=Seiridium unicorne TaxID=138068 RepID=A0ABR2UVS6_9PEZI